MLIANNVCKKFGSFHALDNVSFEINKGDIVGFLGKNGAGKTTLMRILTTFLPATSGKVMIDGDDIVYHNFFDVSFNFFSHSDKYLFTKRTHRVMYTFIFYPKNKVTLFFESKI